MWNSRLVIRSAVRLSSTCGENPIVFDSFLANVSRLTQPRYISGSGKCHDTVGEFRVGETPHRLQAFIFSPFQRTYVLSAVSVSDSAGVFIRLQGLYWSRYDLYIDLEDRLIESSIVY